MWLICFELVNPSCLALTLPRLIEMIQIILKVD